MKKWKTMEYHVVVTTCITQIVRNITSFVTTVFPPSKNEMKVIPETRRAH